MSEIICRICLLTTSNTDEMCYIFENKRGENLSQKIMKIANVQIHENDNITPYICSKCVDNVKKFIEFKKEIEDSNSYLKNLKSIECEYFNKNKIKDIENEIVEISHNQLQEHDEKHEKIIKPKNDKKIVDDEISEDSIESFNFQESADSFENEKKIESSKIAKKQVQCAVCGRTLSSTSLVNHMRIHTGEMPYCCSICPRTFRTNSHLQYHIRVHKGEKNFSCEFCEKAFTTKSDLNQHLRIHTGYRPHLCSVCGKKLPRLYHLQRHMLIHTGEKKFKCDVCGLAFKHKHDVKRHMRSHEAKTEKLPKRGSKK